MTIVFTLMLVGLHVSRTGQEFRRISNSNSLNYIFVKNVFHELIYLVFIFVLIVYVKNMMLHNTLGFNLQVFSIQINKKFRFFNHQKVSSTLITILNKHRENTSVRGTTEYF